MSTQSAATMAQTPTRVAVPHRPVSTRPVGKSARSSATVTGRNEPSRLNTHRARLDPARAWSGRIA